ncbi:glycosyltransferase family 39 protein [Ilumatobacter sp.]|uniref:glycosyltransferase family 39 protein n=1 Tax=Ilumatobacter sp. TaxID=1967498 RepID=UPI003AF90E19
MPVSERLPGPLARLVARRWFPHVTCFVAALVLRVAWVLWVDRDGFVLNDAMMYNANAVAINEGLGFRPPQGGPSAQWPPAYSTILAGIYWVFGIEPLWGEIFNAIVGALTVVLLMLLIERVVDRRAAIVGGVMLAVLPGPILWTDVLVTETLYTAMFVLLFLVLAHASPTWPWLVAIGAVIGLGALVRGEALTWGLLPIVLFWRELPRLELARRIAGIAAVVIVILMPWTIRNAIVMDAFVPVATNASATLWSGHHAGATGGQTYPPEEYYLQFDQEPPLRELQSGSALRRDAIEYMVTHPVHELQLVPLKLIHLNRGDSYALDWVNDAPGAAPISPINAERIGVIADVGYYGLLTLFLLGAVVLGRPFWRTRMGRVFAASFLTALFLYGFLYYGNYRYRLPYEPLMVLVAAAFLTQLWRWRRTSERTDPA